MPTERLRARARPADFPAFQRSALGTAVALLVLGTPAQPAFALFKFDANLGATGMYDSNVLRLPDGAALPPGREERSDTITMEAAELRMEQRMGDQRLYVSGEGQNYSYKEYSELDRTEYAGKGGLDWRASDVVDGALSYGQARRMVPLEARNPPVLDDAMQTNKEASAGVNLNVTPAWRVETRGDWLRQDSPSPSVFFELEEKTYTLAGKYLGLGEVAMGLQLQYTDGEFTAPLIPPPPAVPTGVLETSRYEQTAEEFTVDYNVSGLSKLGAKLGATQRRIRDNDAASSNGLTGELQYKRTVSALTKFTLAAFRRLRSYPSFDDYVIETGGSAQLEWQPTLKIYASILGQYLEDSFHNADRTDRLMLVDGGLRYQMFKHFSIRPAVHYEDRSSSDGSFDFTDVVYALEARVNF